MRKGLFCDTRFKGDIDIDVDIDSHFGCLNGASKSVRVLLVVQKQSWF